MEKMTNRQKADTCLDALLGNNTETRDWWWNSANKGLQGQSPKQVWESGEEGEKQILGYLFYYLQR